MSCISAVIETKKSAIYIDFIGDNGSNHDELFGTWKPSIFKFGNKISILIRITMQQNNDIAYPLYYSGRSRQENRMWTIILGWINCTLTNDLHLTTTIDGNWVKSWKWKIRKKMYSVYMDRVIIQKATIFIECTYEKFFSEA